MQILKYDQPLYNGDPTFVAMPMPWESLRVMPRNQFGAHTTAKQLAGGYKECYMRMGVDLGEETMIPRRIVMHLLDACGKVGDVPYNGEYLSAE
jgi:hypothetical protein